MIAALVLLLLPWATAAITIPHRHNVSRVRDSKISRPQLEVPLQPLRLRATWVAEVADSDRTALDRFVEAELHRSDAPLPDANALRAASQQFRIHDNSTMSVEDPPFLSLVQGSVQPGKAVPLHVDREALHSLAGEVLRRYTECPLLHYWIDLGARFWPRWFRDARCATGRASRKSCSIPSGLYCEPHGYTNRTVLRYYCGGIETQHHTAGNCSWIGVDIPVLVSCSCGSGQ